MYDLFIKFDGINQEIVRHIYKSWAIIETSNIDDKKQKMIFIIAISLLNISCRNTTECEYESWRIINTPIDSNCNLYMMYFFSGDYMFKVSNSGKCQSLTKEIYIFKYDSLLKEYQNDIPIKSGKIIFDYYSFEDDLIFTNRLIKLTNSYFKTRSKIIEKSKEELVIEIY